MRREGKERKKIWRKKVRGREEARSHRYPTPSLLFFAPAHISLRCPHDLNSWNRLSRDKSRDQCSMSRNIQITEQKDLQMSSLFLAFRGWSEGEKLMRKKNDGRLKGKRGRNPRPRPSLLSFSHAYDLTPPPSEFRALLSECTEQANMTELSRWYVIHPAAQSIAIDRKSVV